MKNLVSIQWPAEQSVTALEIEYLRRAVDSCTWTHGHFAREFEARFAEWLGVKYALLVPNGTAAVSMSILALGLRPGEEVIVPAITWPSVISAITYAGGVPVCVDIDPNTLCMDPKYVESAITEKTRLVVATHLYGSQCAVEEILRIAGENGVSVIEDVAQSIGSISSGRTCGSFGEAGAFSLNQKKVLACGEGGVVTTNNEFVWSELQRQHLIDPERDSNGKRMPGTYKVSEFQAAVALAQLAGLDKKLDAIGRGAQVLRAKLDEHGIVTPQALPPEVGRQSYYNFAFHCPKRVDRAEIERKFLEGANLKIRPPYRPLPRVADLFANKAQGSHHVRKLKEARVLAANAAYDWRSYRIPFACLLADDETIVQLAEFISRVFEEQTRAA
ncbi:DegT/DnrJ/EryC1/StrS family aminotransferase [Erythrobacter sp. GH1-10]|uniref:DegT/DnrJ/EryC1/StrS family aminotransferase n=1 Tax=Erythrobacter sp. GH1-10 TaxID=3349334 RepID=UPI003877B03E